MFSGGSKAAPKKAVKKAIAKKPAAKKPAAKKPAAKKPVAKTSSPMSGLFAPKAAPASKKKAPAPKKVVKKAVKAAPPKRAVKKVVKKAAPKKLFKKAAAKKPAASPFAAMFAPKAPAAKKPVVSTPKPKPKPPPPPSPKVYTAGLPPAAKSKAAPGKVVWLGNGQRTVIPAKPVRPPPPPPRPPPRYSADVKPKRKSDDDDIGEYLPLLGVTAGAFVLTNIASAPPPPPPSSFDGGLVLPLLAVTALAGLAAFVFLGDEEKDAPATPSTPVPMPDDGGTADAPADATRPDSGEPETEAAPPS